MPEVLTKNRVLTGREPMLDLRSALGNRSDGLKHLDALEVATVEPAEIGLARLRGLPVDELDHGFDPLRIAETIQSSLICRVYLRTAKVTFEGVALSADATGDGGELGADLAGDGGDAPGVAGHLAGVGEATDNFPGLGAGEGDELGEDGVADGLNFCSPVCTVVAGMECRC